MAFQSELDVALNAVAAAGDHIMEIYREFKAIPDAKADITTDADRQAQEIILKRIHQSFPADRLCAEEATPTLDLSPKKGSRMWVVDPIDGTRGFAQKNGEFSIMIGLLEGEDVILGVVAEPAKGRLTYASRGNGCWMKDVGFSEPKPCQVSQQGELGGSTLIQSRSKPGFVSTQVKVLGPAQIIESHSAGIKLARIARGEADLYVNHYPKFYDWDVVAGHVLVSEAGGKIACLNRQPIRYGADQRESRNGFLASNKLLFEKALTLLSAAF
jgi:3'(2'), 5'-bisphosphate nucleotidase